jgi:hypothetical protein
MSGTNWDLQNRSVGLDVELMCIKAAYVPFPLISLIATLFIHTHYHYAGTLLLWNAHKLDVLKLDTGMKLVLLALHYGIRRPRRN